MFRAIPAALAGTILTVVVLAGPATAADGPIAVIGDYGTDSAAAAQVAAAVHARDPVAVVTLGDNIYRPGDGSGSVDYPRAVAVHYCRYLASAPPSPQCPAVAMSPVNRFFPAAGNHDYSDAGIEAFQGTFVAARSRTWYAVTLGEIEFLILDSQQALDDPASMAAQRTWLQNRAQTSSARWQVAVLHHPPYSSSTGHGSTPAFQWPYRGWGIDLVLAGHDHGYERLRRWGLTYVVNGSGGASLYPLGTRVMGSIVGNDRMHGALYLQVRDGRLRGEFRSVQGALIDAFAID